MKATNGRNLYLLFALLVVVNVNLNLDIDAIMRHLVPLDKIGSDGIDNEAMYCVWNDWNSRDQVAKIHGTFNNCRFSKQHYALGFIPNGRIYCTYKREVCLELGNRLDQRN